MSDHAGANFNAVATVFGKQIAKDRMIGCGFHFLQDARRRIPLLPEQLRDRFMQTCSTLDRVSTKWNFLEVQKSLKEFVDATPALDAWFKWWMARRSHTFSAFVNPDAPKVNLAEAGNKSFNVRGNTRKLVDATYRDISSMMMQDKQLVHFQTQVMPVNLGRGPSSSQLATKERHQQMKRASEYGHALLNMESNQLEMDETEDFHPGRRTNFKPPPKKKTYDVQGSSTLPCYSAITRAEVLKQITVVEEYFQLVIPNMGRPNWKNSPSPNPPTIKLFEDISKKVSRCQGCRFDIDRKMTLPMDMVMMMRGPRPYFTKEGEKRESEGNLYFHCRWSCILKKYPQTEVKEVTASDFTFTKLTTNHFRMMQGEGMLEALVSSKKFQ